MQMRTGNSPCHRIVVAFAGIAQQVGHGPHVIRPAPRREEVVRHRLPLDAPPTQRVFSVSSTRSPKSAARRCAGQRAAVPVVADGVAVRDRAEARHLARRPVLAGGLDHHRAVAVGDDEAAVEMAVAAELAIAALAEAVEQVGDEVDRLVPRPGAFEDQAQEVDQHDAVLVARAVAEHRLVADRDAVLVDARSRRHRARTTCR